MRIRNKLHHMKLLLMYRVHLNIVMLLHMNRKRMVGLNIRSSVKLSVPSRFLNEVEAKINRKRNVLSMSTGDL